MIWREKRVLLAILGVLLLGNIGFFFTYRVQYQNRLEDLDQRLAQAQGQLDQAHIARVKAERTLQAYRKVEQDVEEVFDREWSTKEERLTTMIAEVKRLAIASGLDPMSYSFDRLESQPIVKGSRLSAPLGAEEVGISFAVEGSYEQVRRLINLLELSRQFVIVDRVGLTARPEGRVGFSLHLKTLFRDGQTTAAAGKRL